MNIFETAARVEQHPVVRQVLLGNIWKIDSWADYASWKKHGRKYAVLTWRWYSKGR